MNTFCVKNEIGPSSGERIITIVGNITLLDSLSLKEELLSFIDSDMAVDTIAVKLSEIDLSGLQLLVALKKQLLLDGIKAKFELEFSSELHSLVERSGFLTIL